MTRRVSLPGVDELFRGSKAPAEGQGQEEASTEVSPAREGHSGAAEALPAPDVAAIVVKGMNRQVSNEHHSSVEAVTLQPVPPLPAPSGAGIPPEEGRRPRHDEKVTFYCTASDLTRIERARLTLRADHRLASDRGRIVRAALAEMLDDFEKRGPDSALVARLRLPLDG